MMNKLHSSKDNKNITIKDIARIANVSKSTVSRALSGKGLVAPKTRENILKIVEQYNYKPSVIFSIMASRRHRNKQNQEITPIALLYDEELKNHKLFMSLKNDYASQAGFHLENISVSSTMTAGKIQGKLANLGVEGVLIYRLDSAKIADLDLSAYSVLAINRGHTDKAYFDYIRPDHFNHIVQAWQKAMEHGHTKIGVALGGGQDYSSHDSRLQYGAFAECQHQWKEQIEIIPPYMGDFNAKDEFLKWYYKYQPSCIIGLKIDFYYMLKSANILVPEDVSFISLIRGDEDDDISGINRSDKETLQLAISQLEFLIRSRSKGLTKSSMSIYIRSKWIDGKTLSELA